MASENSHPHVLHESGSTPQLAMPEAVLWDMDGTLVDTEVHWFAAEKDVMVSNGYAWSHQDSLEMVGASEQQMITTMQERGLPLSSERIAEEINKRVLQGVWEDLRVRPGALDILLQCRQHNIPTALVTNSRSALASAVVQRLTIVAQQDYGWSGQHLFDVTVTSDIGLAGKPDPAPYIFAFRRLSALQEEKNFPALNQQRVIVIEDSHPGIQAAQAAGLYTVAVTNIAPLQGQGAQLVLDSLEETTLEKLGQGLRNTGISGNAPLCF